MTICYFGIYNPEYARNKVLLTGLAEHDCRVVECHVDPRTLGGLQKYLQLFKQGWRLRHEPFDVIFVAFPGQAVMWLARLLFPRKVIIFDAFISFYDSNVRDRKLYSRFHPLVLRDIVLDWQSALLADHILMDTYPHIEFYSSMYRIRKSKFSRISIGTDIEHFNPFVYNPSPDESVPKKEYIIHFHGSFIPLQGIPYIIEAADILRDEPAIFRIIGSDSRIRPHIEKQITEIGLMDTVHLVGNMPLSEIPRYISEADICLGIFGETEKTHFVIPNKVFEYAAMRKPIVTADTASVRELFQDGENAILCAYANGSDLAEKIKRLLDDPELRERISQNAYRTIIEKASPKILAGQVLQLPLLQKS